MDSWAAGGLIPLAITNQKKSLHSSSFRLLHTSSAAGLPNASFRPMPVKGRISRRGPSGSHVKPLAWVPTPRAWVRQTGLCVLEPAKPGCDCELESDLSWAPAPVRKKRTSLGCFFRSGLKCQFCDSLMVERCQGSCGQLRLSKEQT